MINTFENACVVENKIYFFSFEVNGLFEIDLKEKKCAYIGSLKKYNNKIRLFGDLTYINGKIIMAPTSADDFVIYDLQTKVEQYIPVEKCEKDYNINCKFLAAIPMGMEVYFIGHWYPAIVQLDLESGNVIYYRDWCDELGKDYFRHTYCIRNEKIILSCSYTNKILIFNTKSKKHVFLEIGAKERRYGGILHDGKNYWLSPRSDNIIVKWDGFGNYKEMVIDNKNIVSMERGLSYSQSFLVDHYVIILPLNDFPVCIIDIHTDTIKIINSEKFIKGQQLGITSMRGGFVFDNILFVINSYDSKIYKLDIENMCFVEIGLDTINAIETCDLKNILFTNLDFESNKLVYENLGQNLEVLIKNIVIDAKRITMNSKQIKKLGYSIWHNKEILKRE